MIENVSWHYKPKISCCFVAYPGKPTKRNVGWFDLHFRRVFIRHLETRSPRDISNVKLLFPRLLNLHSAGL
ncbi:hypothetical protein VTN49DRAFT_4219 [Thermomyces lanuginosus]|uniref:uncharacterized protein n=1 Tax=Thermomyces lanuginosus TaxID=5541 RepID=UPI0037428A6D